jgi:hypothetical protein
MAQKFLTEITLQALNNATTDTDKFLVSDGGTIKFRTGAEVLSDIGGQVAGNYVPTSRTLTINGVTYDLSADRSWTVSVTETDTLATVTGRGASTSTLSNFNGGLTASKTSKTAYGIQLKGAFYGAPRLQLYDLAVDGNAFLGLGVDMSTAPYEFSNYFPRVGGSGRWSVGSWAGDFGTGQYVSGYNEKLWVNENAAQFNVNLGAPLFYDSNNSAYYLDPSSTSNLYGLTVATTINGNITGSASYASTANYANVAGVADFARRIAGPDRLNFTVGGDANTFYPIAIYTGANGTTEQYSEFMIERGGYDDPGYTGIGFSTFNARFSFKPTAWGYGANYFNLEQLTQTTPCLGDYSDQYQSSQAIIWLRGGTTYWIYSIVGTITMVYDNSAGGDYVMTYDTYTPITSPVAKAQYAKYYGGSMLIDGSIVSNSDMKAPIFYDSDNTSFYIDLAANTSIRTFGSWRANSSPWDGEFAGKIQYHDDSWYFQGGNRFIFRTPGGSEPFTVGQSGSAVATGDMRAPIFYDSNNSGYYIDPASASNISSMSANNIIRSSKAQADNNYTTAAIWTESYNTTTTGIAFHISGLVGKFLEMRTNGILYWDNAPVVTTSTISVSFDSLINKGGGTGVYQTTGDFRAPIFYDLNNTSYYIDAGGTSNLYNLDISGASHKYLHLNPGNGYEAMVRYTGGTGSSWFVGKRTSNDLVTTADFHFFSQASGLTVAGVDVSGNLYAYLSMRTPIYYDSNNTGYYVDPSATSNLNGLLVGGLNVIKTWQTIAGNIDNDYGEGFVTFDPVPTGTPPLASPNIRTVNIGENFSRRTQLAFDYASDLAYFRRRSDTGWQTWREFIHSGNIGSQSVSYATTAGTASGVAWAGITGKPSNIFYYQGFTLDANTMDTNSSGFTYANNAPYNGPVARFSAAGGYDLWLNADYGGGTGFAFRTRNGDTGTFNAWRYPALYNTNVNSGGDLYASIYYDQNDTAYYLNPNNTTTAANLAGKVQISYGGASSSVMIQATGSYGTMSLNTYYGVFHTSGDFYIGNPASTGNNLSGNYAYFSIFYDRNNSAYYVDAAATSNLLGLTVANTITGTVSNITNNTNLLVNALAAPAFIDGLTTTNFRSTLFNTTSNGYQISTARWNTTPSVLSGLNPYSTMIAWSGSDTQGFLAMDYNTPAARMGGGNANNINWTRRVLLEDVWTNNKYFSSGGEIYGTAFYDANDSTYYFDGSSTGDSIRCAGDIVAYYSDERLKDRKGNIENALEKVLSLNGFYYEPNKTAQALGYKKKLEVGVSAQEVQAILPEIIKDAPIGGDYKTLDYGRLTPLLIEAIKEQQKQIEELKELVNKLINK